MAIDAVPRLTLYSRSYCHLCDDMVVRLRQLQAGIRFEFDVVDVDRDPVLERRYGDKVPVLACGERELCHYFLDPAVITAFLAEFR
ncbi:MAG: glutaredoxin family protein [Betaproteobacteria bacterium]|nr:glutaredoxin family protein [Betaproteobacteria bacterium]